jgi:hypothetical protein
MMFKLDPIILFKDGWSKPQLVARAKAAIFHLLASLAVAVVVTIPMVFWLYPFPHFEASGGYHLLGLILIVDVVLGPLLTFLVFDRRKASLTRDLKTIVAVQLLALGYGLYATAMSRPVFMTYVVDRFETVSAAEADEVELLKAPKEIQTIRWGHPQIAYAKQPESQEERNAILFASVNAGVDLKAMFRYYQPFDLARPQIIARGKPVLELEKFNTKSQIAAELKGLDPALPLLYVPLQGKKRDLTVLLNSKDGSLVKVVALQPW